MKRNRYRNVIKLVHIHKGPVRTCFVLLRVDRNNLFRKTDNKFGKNLYAVGGNPEAAAVSGMSVFAVTLGAFIMAGILYGFGSWLECTRMVGSGSASFAQLKFISLWFR